MAVALKRRLDPRILEIRRHEPVRKVGESSSGPVELSDSWQRCTVEHHLARTTPTAPNILTESEIRASRESIGDIVFRAREEINRLYAIVRQQDYVVLLCDRDGIAVHHRGDEHKAEEFKYWGIWEGGVWSEEVEGTNGIGTCILEQRPVSVDRGQHFRQRHGSLSCAGVPIFDQTGVLAGVLDSSAITAGRSDQSHALVLAATKVVAREVEERIFRESFRQRWNLAAVPSDESDPAVLLAVDNDQRIVGADHLARQMLGVNDTSLKNGVHLSSFFEYSTALFRDKGGQDIPARWTTPDGQSWHLLISPPSGKLDGWNRAEAASYSRPRISLLGTLPIPLSPSPHRGGLPPLLARRICEYIDSHLGEKITLNSLAATVGLSVDHFAHAFRQSVGLPPHAYLLHRRVEAAQNMLLHSDLSLSQVALATGFSDYSHLARHFARLVGTSPRELRRSRI